MNQEYELNDFGFLGGRLPVVEVEVVETEIRRLNRRMLPPQLLKFVGTDGACHDLELTFLSNRSQSHRKARVCDVGVGGFGIETSARLQPGDDTSLYGRDATTGEVLFEEKVRVMNERSESHRKSQQYRHVYGLMTLQEKHSTLYKCILDSIFLSHLCDGESPIEELPFNPTPHSH